MQHKGGLVREAEEDILVEMKKKSQNRIVLDKTTLVWLHIDNVIINDPAAEITWEVIVVMVSLKRTGINSMMIGESYQKKINDDDDKSGI